MRNSFPSIILLSALIGGVAFSAPAGSNDTATAFFEFDAAHNAPTLFNVQDESKWLPVNSIGACSNQKVRACRIEVSREYVRGNTLLPTATIAAQESSRDTAFVTGGFIIKSVNKN